MVAYGMQATVRGAPEEGRAKAMGAPRQGDVNVDATDARLVLKG